MKMVQEEEKLPIMRKGENDGNDKGDLIPMMSVPPPFVMNNNINGNSDNLLSRLNAFLPQMAAANQGTSIHITVFNL